MATSAQERGRSPTAERQAHPVVFACVLSLFGIRGGQGGFGTEVLRSFIAGMVLVVGCGGVAGGWMVGCGERQPSASVTLPQTPRGVAAAAPKAAVVEAKANAITEQANVGSAARLKALSAVYAWSRCVQLGVLSPSTTAYTAHGFQDDAAFRAAFAAAADRDPLWARKTVEAAQQQSCRELGKKP